MSEEHKASMDESKPARVAWLTYTWQKVAAIAAVLGVAVGVIVVIINVNEQQQPPGPPVIIIDESISSPVEQPVIETSEIQGPAEVTYKQDAIFDIEIIKGTDLSFTWELEPVQTGKVNHVSQDGSKVTLVAQPLVADTKAMLTVTARSSVDAGVMDKKSREIIIKAAEPYYVYTDAFVASSLFEARALMSSNYDSPTSYASMDEECVEDPHQGLDCIECKFFADGNNWAGFYFLAGAEKSGNLLVEDDDIVPNWGKHKEKSYDLQGALRLTFWAKGAEGGEKVEFVVLGVGRDHRSGEVEKDATFPGSSPRETTGTKKNTMIPLTSEWVKHTIVLEGKDLSRVLGGFGWSTSARKNGGNDIVFYLDDIQYEFVPYPEE